MLVVAGPRTSRALAMQLSGQLKNIIKKQEVSEMISKYTAGELPSLHYTCANR